MTGIEELNDPKPSISVILPIYEESETIKVLIPELVECLRRMPREFEVIAVDDGSSDQTGETLARLQTNYPDELIIIRHLRNRGYGAALRTGASFSKMDIVLFMDADGQHDPSEIEKVLMQIPPFDLVIGARLSEYQGSWHRNLANRVYNRFASWLSDNSIDDLTSGFRAMRRVAVQHFLPLFPEGFSASTTITLAFIKAGYNVRFVPVQVNPRAAGESRINVLRDGFRFLLIIFRVIMLYDPLRIFLPTGVLLGALGIFAWILGLLNANRLVLPNSAILLFTAALITVLLGMVSSQISNSMIQYRGDETLIVNGKVHHRSKPLS